jgi:hypothetical protein
MTSIQFLGGGRRPPLYIRGHMSGEDVESLFTRWYRGDDDDDPGSAGVLAVA